jgi:tol-pal system protein YbgF
MRTILRNARLAVPLAGAVLAGGCVSTSDVEGIHKHLNELEKKVDAASAQASSREEVQKLNENLSKQSSTLLRSNAELGTKFDDLVREMQNVAGKLEESNRRLREVSQQMAELQARAGGAPGAAPSTIVVPGVPGAGAPAAGAGAPRAARSPSPSDLFAQATADYQRGQFDLARQGFAEYAETYPKTDLSDDALYWSGECWAAQKKPREAIAAWERLFKQYPDSDKAAAAHLKKAIAHLDLGEKAQAIVELQFVVNEYPRSDESKSARQRLKALGSDVR